MILIRGGRIIDPSNQRDGIFDLLVREGKIFKIERRIQPKKNWHTILAKGIWVFPGLIDAHVHLREPGGEESETIESGSCAAAVGGVTSLLAMANTVPPIDSPQQVRFVVRRAKEKSKVRIFPVGAVTKGLSGEALTDIPALVQAGCVAISDDGHSIMNSQILRRALEHSKSLGIPLIEHCEDQNLSMGGVMNEGELSVKLGLKGIPTESESIMVARNIFLAQLTGAPVHCAHISTADSAALIRNAKQQGIQVTAETCPQYFSLTEEAVRGYNTLAKMKPPLRTQADVAAVRAGLADGTIDIIASDHAPHAADGKEKEFSRAPFGMIGLETLFAVAYSELALKNILTVLKLVQKLTETPAKIFHLPGGSLSVGLPADISLFDPKQEWVVRAEDVASKSSNSPFMGRKLKGKIVRTIVNGKTVFQQSSRRRRSAQAKQSPKRHVFEHPKELSECSEAVSGVGLVL